ncbi:MAG: DUF1080 domain-containing protein [Anaerolineae bacterium]|nr:DUF1080 domain-containing protein [Anaerolineae bacterium]
MTNNTITIPNHDPRWITTAVSRFEQTAYKGLPAVRVSWDYVDDPLVDGGFVPLSGVTFGDGIIEVDMAKGPFVGLGFRGQTGGRYELIYFRPTAKANGWKAIQYGNIGNRLGMPRYLVEHAHPHCDGQADLPEDDWFHIRLVVTGSKAEVYLNGQAQPVYTMPALLQPEQRGSIGLWAWDGYFANFRYTAEEQKR